LVVHFDDEVPQVRSFAVLRGFIEMLSAIAIDFVRLLHKGSPEVQRLCFSLIGVGLHPFAEFLVQRLGALAILKLRMHFPHHRTVGELTTLDTVINIEGFGVDLLEQLGVVLRAQSREGRRVVPPNFGDLQFQFAAGQLVPGHEDMPIGLDKIENPRVLD
jgi:hypothetical protein